MILRYLQWLVQEDGPDAALYHTELALSLAKAALDSLPPSFEGVDDEFIEFAMNDHSLTRGPSMNHDEVRAMLQEFLAASDEYKADEVLSLIEGSELWKEQVRYQPYETSTLFTFLVVGIKVSLDIK